MTSNLAAREIEAGAARAEIMEVVRRQFKPEFVNRLDEIVIFNRLTETELDAIVSLQIEQVNKRLQDRKLKLEINESARRQLAAVGYDPVFGARPLKRAIQNLVLDPLARALLEGRIHDDQTVIVTYKNSQFSLESAKKPRESARVTTA